MARLGARERILFALSALLALSYGLVSRDWSTAGVSHGALATLKASSVVVLAALAIHNRLLAAALAFGALGDALLALDTHASFLVGAGAFLVGHLCYITLFLRTGIGDRAVLREPLRPVAMLLIAAAALVMTGVLVPQHSALCVPLGVYTGVLTLMTMASFTLPAKHWLAMAGAMLFFVSDGFVAANMFHPNPDPNAAFWLSFAGWMIYWAGQAGLCIGALGLKHSPRAA